MKLGVAIVAAAMLLGGARTAHAALTSSEKAVIRDFVSGAHAEHAAKVRSLVARTDLTVEESLAALSEAVSPVPFTEQRGIFLVAAAVTAIAVLPALVLDRRGRRMLGDGQAASSSGAPDGDGPGVRSGHGDIAG